MLDEIEELKAKVEWLVRVYDTLAPKEPESHNPKCDYFGEGYPH